MKLSHFFTVIILPKETPNSKLYSSVEKLLAPFDESLQVPSYEQECYCIRSEIVKDIQEQLNKEFGTFDSARERFREAHPEFHSVESHLPGEFDNELEEERRRLWQREVLDDRDKLERELLATLKKSPIPDCSDCKGTGIVRTEYNPDSKWDYWRVGGRWDGDIKNESRPSSDGGFNFANDHEEVSNNCDITDFLFENQIIPFAIVTPDGKWHEKGKMGWWALVSDEKDGKDWKEMALFIYNKYKGHLAVGCDLHI
ncbi:hypothetical protein A2Z67_05050 [Candidatus Woesebacteria bacterium RBG_13_36_22]|uniref:Uncharacterized protein n=1 Tax=Candidatus Woesebacteria bacterium RBG_13_36_22 TaxID=1802478 RepID=A0A1F7X3K8_9BACT|nr:MAG: hypothetical protein A2Z67_05050 [Candidatus Woesebacteria bacterium RBG_13_36_22]